MARVTADDVYAIMSSEIVVSDTQMNAIIQSATILIDDVFSHKDVSNDLLVELERWLAAHLIASALVRIASKEKVGDAEITYAGKWGDMFMATPYGQMLLSLDTSGELAKAGKASVDIYAVPNFKE